MKADTIRQIARAMPDNPKYPPHLMSSSDAQTSRAGRIQYCLGDPKFGWHCVMTYIDAGQDISPWILEHWLQRAWRWKKFGLKDDTLAEAYSITHPARHQTHDLLHALLICRDMSFEKIISLLNIPLDVLKAYETLFFNCRDRLDDKAYIASLVFSETRLAALTANIAMRQSSGQRLLQAAYEFGSDEVLFIAGLAPRRHDLDTASAWRELENLVAENAVTLARHGGLNAEVSPGLERAKALLIASKKNASPDNLNQPAIGVHTIGQAVMSDLLKLTEGSPNHELVRNHGSVKSFADIKKLKSAGSNHGSART